MGGACVGKSSTASTGLTEEEKKQLEEENEKKKKEPYRPKNWEPEEPKEEDGLVVYVATLTEKIQTYKNMKGETKVNELMEKVNNSEGVPLDQLGLYKDVSRFDYLQLMRSGGRDKVDAEKNICAKDKQEKTLDEVGVGHKTLLVQVLCLP
eukprot:gnl/TRDRNA2_/TRDRNA2_135142_c0_seq1.p1 gnl/TRDRNA2_/TRDRNA2_135142_c0~~gnl/TRDRNA2_/TRDRNA2_135142_c0_seq1.p1  ORF type:complete len:151 (-),score=35.33 gnl/TRDRNA2_/TRDRNA2_135142_c0_seq1:219-671(-)